MGMIKESQSFFSYFFSGRPIPTPPDALFRTFIIEDNFLMKVLSSN